jgi:hypothetical protein
MLHAVFAHNTNCVSLQFDRPAAIVTDAQLSARIEHFVLLSCSVHEVTVDHGILGPGTRVAVKRVDWSTHEQRKQIAKVRSRSVSAAAAGAIGCASAEWQRTEHHQLGVV